MVVRLDFLRTGESRAGDSRAGDSRAEQAEHLRAFSKIKIIQRLFLNF